MEKKIEQKFEKLKTLVSSTASKIFDKAEKRKMFSGQPFSGQPPMKRAREDGQGDAGTAYDVCVSVQVKDSADMEAVYWAWDNPREAGQMFLRGYRAQNSASSSMSQPVPAAPNDFAQLSRPATVTTATLPASQSPVKTPQLFGAPPTFGAATPPKQSPVKSVQTESDDIKALERQKEQIAKLETELKTQKDAARTAVSDREKELAEMSDHKAQLERQVNRLQGELEEYAKSKKEKEERAKSLKLVEFLRNLYPTWQVVERSTSAHSAVFHLTDPDDDLVTVVAHRKEAIERSDLEQFQTYVQSLIASKVGGKCMGVVFVSAATRNIPKIGPLSIEHCGAVPTLFAGFESPIELQDRLQNILKVFMMFCKKAKTVRQKAQAAASEEPDDKKEMIESLFEAITDSFEALKKSCEDIEKLKEQHVQFGQIIQSLSSRNEELYEKLEDFLKENNKIPSKGLFGFLKPW